MVEQRLMRNSYLMKEALLQAELALKRGDRPVGAVIVHKDKIIARGSDTCKTDNNLHSHAVLRAISSISPFLVEHGHECTMYTSYEPCVMCLGAILNYKIPNIFAGTGHDYPRKMNLSQDIKYYLKGFGETDSIRLTEKYEEENLPDGNPLPPAHLIKAVIPAYDKDEYFKEGKLYAEMMMEILSRHSISITGMKSILDFGCGCGRLLRHFKKFSSLKICGCDYNAEMIDWCRANLGFAFFETNLLEPPLAYSEKSFDFIFARSVFTHLSEPLQKRWMDEFHRVLNNDGILLFTTHGQGYISQLNPQQLADYHAGRLVVKNTDVMGSNDCASFQSEGHVRNVLSRGFQVLDCIPSKTFQDIYLFRKQ